MDANDELKQRLVHYLDSLESAVKTGGGVLAREAPEVVREMVAYQMASAALSCVAAVVILAGFGAAAWSVYRKPKEIGHEFEVLPPALIGLTAFLATLPGLWLVFSLDTLCKCYFAPRYYVLEQVAELLRPLH